MSSNSSLGIRPYTQGLNDLGNGGYAWLQPDGGWGWSNAGLVVDGDESLLVDTLFDKPLTKKMLDSMRAAEPAAAKSIGQLVNTHSNGDHCNGNELVHGADIIMSAATAEELAHENPEMMLNLIEQAPQMGEMGEFFLHCFGAFDFRDITTPPPTRTFSDELQLSVGDKAVNLKQVGPAHTAGDIIVHVPADGLVFTGDILFIEGHPILWAGPAQNWIDACDYLCGLEVESIVPGHGPITDKRGVRALRGYLVYIRDEAKKRFDAGLSMFDAAMDIGLRDYDSWGDSERIVVNVACLYREFEGRTQPDNVVDLFGLMAKAHRLLGKS